MDTNALVRKIVAEFRKLPDGQQPQNRPELTQTVLTTLCKLGKELDYTTWATSRHPYRIPDEYCDGGEWIYDVCWLQYPSDDHYHRRLISVPMVAECEWDHLGYIEQDFSKLLLAKATLRVMVYDSYWTGGDVAAINNKLCELVGSFNGALGDIYLLIAMVWDDSSETNRFEFAKIVDQGPDNTPILQML